MGASRLAPLAQGHALTVARVSGNRPLNGARGRRKPPPHDGVIKAAHLSRGELVSKGLVSLVIFGDNKKAARLFVQPMHNAGAFDAIDA